MRTIRLELSEFGSHGEAYRFLFGHWKFNPIAPCCRRAYAGNISVTVGDKQPIQWLFIYSSIVRPSMSEEWLLV